MTEAEVSSALYRRIRTGDLDAAAGARAVARLRADLDSLDVVELASSVVGRVHELLMRHPLRAGDALQLASALTLRPKGQRQAEFVCWDGALRAAAESEGFVVLPPD